MKTKKYKIFNFFHIIVINFFPLFQSIFFGWEIEDIIIFYLLETAIIFLFLFIAMFLIFLKGNLENQKQKNKIYTFLNIILALIEAILICIFLGAILIFIFVAVLGALKDIEGFTKFQLLYESSPLFIFKQHFYETIFLFLLHLFLLLKKITINFIKQNKSIKLDKEIDQIGIRILTLLIFSFLAGIIDYIFNINIIIIIVLIFVKSFYEIQYQKNIKIHGPFTSK